MALVRKLKGIEPSFGKNCFLAETAVIIGDVEMGSDCSIWYGAVLRGDVNSIRLGNRVNVQDNAVIHTTYQKSVSIIEDDVTIAHNACIHGATLKKGCLIGIGAVVLDNAVVGEGAIVAANSVVLNNTVIDPGCLYAGSPAKFVKKVDTEQSRNMNERIARSYLMYSGWYKEE
jgi:carbonic anhydrase/acetyltransferase-like protein (isoleucine patch superfamily)